MNDSNEFRELIRKIERNLGLLNREGNTARVTGTSECCCKVSLAQCHALVEIGRASDISVKELSSILGLDKSTMSRTVDALVKKEYAVRTQSEADKRCVNIKLTAKGTEVFDSIENRMNEKFKNAFNEIKAEDREVVLKSMRILVTVLGKENFN